MDVVLSNDPVPIVIQRIEINRVNTPLGEQLDKPVDEVAWGWGGKRCSHLRASSTDSSDMATNGAMDVPLRPIAFTHCLSSASSSSTPAAWPRAWAGPSFHSAARLLRARKCYEVGEVEEEGVSWQASGEHLAAGVPLWYLECRTRTRGWEKGG